MLEYRVLQTAMVGQVGYIFKVLLYSSVRGIIVAPGKIVKPGQVLEGDFCWKASCYIASDLGNHEVISQGCLEQRYSLAPLLLLRTGQLSEFLSHQHFALITLGSIKSKLAL